MPAERFSWRDTAAALESWLTSVGSVEAGPRNRGLVGQLPDGSWQRFSPPLLLAPLGGISAPDDLRHLPSEPPTAIVALVQAGAAALGYLADGELIEHKVQKSYMVRKKQGRSQLTYLKSKGKSRAGSRLRLRNALTFFEAINEKLAEWIERHGDPQRMMFSCPVRLRAEWFRADVPPPAPWDDPRWLPIPLDVRVPSFDELRRVVFETTHGRIEPLGPP